MLSQKFAKFAEWAAGPYAHTDTCLGIHYREQAITSVRVEKRGETFELTFLEDIPNRIPNEREDANDHTQSNTDPSLEAPAQSLRTLANDPLISSVAQMPVVLSLDGSLYHTQNHHSDFDDPKQIEQTF